MSQSSTTLPESWDCHTHVLDPIRFPYRPDRKYTPEAAPLASLIESSTAQKIVIVQATPEEGPNGLLHQLNSATTDYSERIFRGILSADTSSPMRDVRFFSRSQADKLHSAGIRSVRIQGIYASLWSTIESYLSTVATSYPVAHLKWSISMQLPLESWMKLHDFLFSLPDVRIIADHNGSARPEDLDSVAFARFLDLLRKRPNTFVKIGALHRRVRNGSINAMRDVVKAIADAASYGILWGSDWPHVDTSKPVEETAPHLNVNSCIELEEVKEWLSEEQFRAMMVKNPARLFT